MKISLNEIKKYVDVPEGVSTEELVKLIGSRLVEVEGTIDLKPKYEGIVVVKVAECERIPDTHLSLCQVDDGSGELTQVVCGAPNVHKGMLTAWIKPGAIVPVTYGNEDFRLSVRKLRGHESNGMLAAADELDLGDSHEGIIEIEPGFCEPGTSFIEAFGLDDIILDIENKSLTHRPDCFGIVGFAREVSGILGLKFLNPETVFPAGASARPVVTGEPRLGSVVTSAHPQKIGLSDLKTSTENIEVTIDNPDVCEKYCCAVVEVEGAAEKSKYFTLDDVFLAKAGMRSISKIVDVTNILMLLTGQPLHAFDYDKFVKVGGGKKAKVGVRLAKEVEELQLLDGKTIECDANDILITSNNVPVALAGAMGGASTEIDASTKRVLLESATFSLYHLRKTQMKHGIFSEAITRFTKGQPAGNAMPVLLLAIKLLSEDGISSSAGVLTPVLRSASQGAVVTGLDPYRSAVACAMPKKACHSSKEGVSQEVSQIAFCAMPKKACHSSKEILANKPIKLSVKQVNSLLGTEYSEELCVKTLTNVGFEVSGQSVPKNGDTILTVTAPYWRTDIHIPEDVIEEIGRLNGFDNIPKTLASRPFVQAKLDPMFALKTRLRGILADNLRAHEVLTYSFVSKDLQRKVLEDSEKSYEIVNSLSPELQVFRQSLIPSLLDKVYDNLKAGYKGFALFEMNQVTNTELGKDEDGVPKMENRLAVVVVGNYYRAKAILEATMSELKIAGGVVEADDLAPYFEKGRSAGVEVEKIKKKRVRIGAIGEIKIRVRRALKLEPVVAGFEISLDELIGVKETGERDFKISKFPAVERDITVKATEKVPFATIKSAIEEALADNEDLVFSVEDMSIYQRISGVRNLSFHLRFANMRRTMEPKEIIKIMLKVEKQVKKAKGEII